MVVEDFYGYIQEMEEALRYEDLKSQMAKDQLEQVPNFFYIFFLKFLTYISRFKWYYVTAVTDNGAVAENSFNDCAAYVQPEYQ